MKNNRWEVAKGASNLGEDDIRVAVLKVESEGSDSGIVKVAYCAYSGLKIIEVTGISNVSIDESNTSDFAENFERIIDGVDWEVGLIVEVEGHNGDVVLTINDCESIELISMTGDLTFGVPSPIEVLSSEEYMVDEYDNLDIDLLKIFSYI